MAIPHGHRLTGNLEFDLAAKAGAFVVVFATHIESPCNIAGLRGDGQSSQGLSTIE
jgi:hypothetical protein